MKGCLRRLLRFQNDCGLALQGRGRVLLKATNSRHEGLENSSAPAFRSFESRTRILSGAKATSTQFVPPEALLIFHSRADGAESDICGFPSVV